MKSISERTLLSEFFVRATLVRTGRDAVLLCKPAVNGGLSEVGVRTTKSWSFSTDPSVFFLRYTCLIAGGLLAVSLLSLYIDERC